MPVSSASQNNANPISQAAINFYSIGSQWAFA
jgi:hypothetical protein